MINILLGPYGHGKSTEIIKNIQADYENKVRSFLIVPEQQTVISEREIAKSLPPRAQLYTEATNFTRLANSVFRKYGGLKYNYVTSGGKNLIMYRAICEVRDLLKQYKIPKGREKACISLFLQAIGEMKSYCVNIALLEQASALLENQSLKARIEDIITVWSVYERLMAEHFSDPYDDILMLSEKLSEHNYFEGCNVYFDSFYGFTLSQFDVIAKIINQAENVTFAFDCPTDATDNTMQYSKIASTKNSIVSLCKRLKKDFNIKSFDTDFKHENNEEIKYICNNIWKFDAEPIQPQGSIKLVKASNEFDACEYIAIKIKELISKGYKYSDIAIVARNSDTYRGIIDFQLSKLKIPYHFSAPSKLMAQPAIKMIISALNAIGSYRIEDTVNYSKCGYLDIDDESLYLLENYIYRWNIYGKKFKDINFWASNPDGYVKDASDEQKNALKKIIDARKAIIDNLEILEKPFVNQLTIRDCATAVFDFLNAHKLRDKLNEEIKASDDIVAQELLQVWNAIVTALDTIVEICGDAKCDIETFTTLLTYAMMDTKIGTIPAGEDNVIIGDASLIRAKSIKQVFVLGVNEGVFPAIISDDSFFSDSDKVALETHGIELSSKTKERQDDELLFFKNSIALASEEASVISLSQSISGNTLEPSIAYTRLFDLFIEPTEIDASDIPVINRIYNEETAIEYYGSADCELKEAITQLVDIKPSGSFDNKNDSINKSTIDKIFTNRLNLSKSTLESFIKCRFNYYCKYVLNLRSSKKIKFGHVDIGYLVHDVFEHFIGLYNDGKVTFKDEEISDSVAEITDNYVTKVCGNRANSNKMRHFFARLKATICVFVRNMLDEISASGFKPEYLELDIAGDGINNPPPLTFDISDDVKARVTGVADRVDVLRADGKTYIKIVDYKTGNYTFDMDEINRGLGLQMLIYLLALCNMDKCKFKEKLLEGTSKISPYGITYMPLKINQTKIANEIPLNSADAVSKEKSETENKISRQGFELDNNTLWSSDSRFDLGEDSKLSDKEINALFDIVKSTIKNVGLAMLSGDASAEPDKESDPCKYCDNKAICRRKD